MSEDVEPMSYQESTFMIYRIEARMKKGGSDRPVKIGSAQIMERWKKISFHSDMFEGLDRSTTMWQRHDESIAFLLYELSGEMAGFLIHKLSLLHQEIEFRIIPIDCKMRWEKLKEGPPMKLDLTFHEMEDE